MNTLLLVAQLLRDWGMNPVRLFPETLLRALQKANEDQGRNPASGIARPRSSSSPWSPKSVQAKMTLPATSRAASSGFDCRSEEEREYAKGLVVIDA